MKWEVQSAFTAGYNFIPNTEQLFDWFFSPCEYLRKQMRIREWKDYDIYNTVSADHKKAQKARVDFKGGHQTYTQSHVAVSLWALLTWGCLARRQKGRVEKWGWTWKKGGKSSGCSSMPEFRNMWPIHICTSSLCYTKEGRQSRTKWETKQ